MSIKFTKEQLKRQGIDPKAVKAEAAKAREIAKAEREDAQSPRPDFKFDSTTLQEAEQLLSDKD
jgi:hypothetical protein